jgi:hypothetical protein
MMGGQRHEDFVYPDDQWYYFQFADRFGWTPDQVDDLPATTADWLISIAATYESAKAERMKE